MKTKMDNFPAINPNPVLSVNKVGTVLYSNEASEPLLKEWGGEIGEKLPSSIADIVHRVITRNNPEKIEVKVGKRVYLLTFHPVSKEECVNIYGFDISEQKELEEKLRESEERYRAFFNTSAVGTAEIDLTGRLTKVNDRFCQITGYSHKELLRMKILELSHPDDRDNDSKNLVDYLNGRTSTLDIEKRYVRKDGRVIWVEVTAAIVCSLEGRPLRSMGVIQDITKRKKAEEALKEAYDSLEMKVKERTDELEEAQRIARIGNWSWNIASDEAHWSDEMYRIFGRDPQKLAPPYIEYLNYVHPDDREHADNAHKEALSGKSFSMDHRIILPNGEERTIHMKTEVIFIGHRLRRNRYQLNRLP